MDSSVAATKAESISRPQTILPGLGEGHYPGFPTADCPETMPKLSKHYSLMASVLSGDPVIYDHLKDLKTRNGVTFAACIKPGMDDRGNPGLPSPGLVAGDADCYELFSELFVPVLEKLHSEYSVERRHPHPNLSPIKLSNSCIDPGKKYVIKTHLQIKRNLNGFRLAPQMSDAERTEVERLVAFASLELPANLAGVYRCLPGSRSQGPDVPAVPSDAMDDLLRKGLIF